MIDDILFQRGHIMTQIDDMYDDFDIVIPEYYFFKVLGLEGEVTDSNGSEYELLAIDSEDNFELTFTIYDNEFETSNGETVSFEELMVSCTGKIIEDNGKDVLFIETYDVVNVKD